MSNTDHKGPRLDRRGFVAALTAGVAAAGAATATGARAAEPAATPEPGSIWWNEYLSANLEKTSYFYANVMGWNMKLVSLEEPSRLAKPGEKGYIVMLSGGDEAAGVMRLEDSELKQQARPGWFTYLQVDNVDAAAARVVSYGGKVVREPVDSDDGMRIAVIEDPEGCLVGLAARIQAKG